MLDALDGRRGFRIPPGRMTREAGVMTMTYDLAMAASRDAGNRSMRKGGRKRWSEGDYNVAVEALDRFYPHEQRIAESHDRTRAVENGELGRCAWCGDYVRFDEAGDHVAHGCAA